VPGIVRATLVSGTVGLGGKVRVENTDGSVHHETFVKFVPEKRSTSPWSFDRRSPM
jgi:hypothetical protein